MRSKSPAVLWQKWPLIFLPLLALKKKSNLNPPFWKKKLKKQSRAFTRIRPQARMDFLFASIEPFGSS